MNDLVIGIVGLIFGGGLWKGIESIIRARTDSKEKDMLTKSVGARTPAEIESVSVATMSTALKSAQTQIDTLIEERSKDQTYYQERIARLEVAHAADRELYQARIIELSKQLEHVRDEMETMETKLTELLAETHTGTSEEDIT